MIYRLTFLALLFWSKVLAQDPDLYNYKTGIDLNYGDSATTYADKTVGYMEEYLYHDPAIESRKIVYIRDSVQMNVSKNSRDIANKGSGQGYDLVTDIVGWAGGEVVKYKVDGDRRWEKGQPSGWTTFPSNLTFASMNYGLYGDSGVNVVGSTGDNGVAFTAANKESHYSYGTLDDVGDEWHWLTIADDGAAATPTPNSEYQANDGKIWYFVVNPKTPGLTVKATGDGEFYTTPAKVYFLPKIHEQTTYFDANTGSVTFELHDLYGNNVFYRIVTDRDDAVTPYTDAGADNVILDQTDFSDGTQYLQYYYSGNAAYTKTRIVVENPSYPSASETHGDRMWVSASQWTNEVKPRIDGNSTLTSWMNYYKNEGSSSFMTKAGTGLRQRIERTWRDAMAARHAGMTATDSDGNRYSDIAKAGLLENIGTIDPIGWEQNHNFDNFPGREWFQAGYNDVEQAFSAALAYDILIGYYREDQGYTNGITPVEDYMIRDHLALWVHICMMDAGNWDDESMGTGMWETAKKIGAYMITIMMPAYSTPYYGTSGFDGTTTTYADMPFPTDQYTWKEVFIDNNKTLGTFPNLAERTGIEEYMFDATGNWTPRIAYSDTYLMGHTMVMWWNLSRYYAPNTDYTRTLLAMDKAAAGTLEGKIPAEGTVYRMWAGAQNSWFNDFYNDANSYMLSLDNTNNNSLNKQVQRGGPHYLIYYNHNLPLQFVTGVRRKTSSIPSQQSLIVF